MDKKAKNEKTGEKTARKTGSGGKGTKDLTRRHLKDKDDKITDEDIRDIKIDTSGRPDKGTKISEGDERAHDQDKDHKFTTPWDTIKE